MKPAILDLLVDVYMSSYHSSPPVSVASVWVHTSPHCCADHMRCLCDTNAAIQNHIAGPFL